MHYLGVNVDHIATLREARQTIEPNPVEAAFLAEIAGCHGITVHLREDRRHIQDDDVLQLKKRLRTRLNLEMANSADLVDFALKVRPFSVCFVPERRSEVTTEGGLQLTRALEAPIKKLQAEGVLVSLFIDPDLASVRAAKGLGSNTIELHTGAYAGAFLEGLQAKQADELARLVRAADLAADLDLTPNAGHGLTYFNLEPLVRAQRFHEFNIGHSIVSRAALFGMERAVKDMLQLLGTTTSSN